MPPGHFLVVELEYFPYDEPDGSRDDHDGGWLQSPSPDSSLPFGVRSPVRVATTTNGTLASAFDNGSTVDGVVLVTGDRILVKDQSNPAENGIYTVNSSGSPTRATDDSDWTAVATATVLVREGTANAHHVFVLTLASPLDAGTGVRTYLDLSAFGATQTSWVPALTATTTSPSLGTVDVIDEGHFHRLGRRVWFDAVIRFGTTSPSAGSGLCLINLPVAPVTGRTISIGSGIISDSSASALSRSVEAVIIPTFSTSSFVLVLENGAFVGGNNPVAHDKPWTWAASDSIVVWGSYEAATD